MHTKFAACAALIAAATMLLLAGIVGAPGAIPTARGDGEWPGKVAPHS
jgi:hypothetical protein